MALVDGLRITRIAKARHLRSEGGIARFDLDAAVDGVAIEEPQDPRLPSRFSLVRAAIEAGGSILPIQALAVTSLGFVATISLVIPLGVVLFASIFVNERLSRRGHVLVPTGFAGALVAIATKIDTNLAGAFAALGSAGCYLARGLLTRHRGAGESAIEFSAMASLMTLGLALLLVRGGAADWPRLGAEEAGMEAGMVGLYVASNVLIVMATRGGRPGLVAATRYSSVLLAMLIDVLFFGMAPSGSTLLGAAIITVSGLMLLWHERMPKASWTGKCAGRPTYRAARN